MVEFYMSLESFTGLPEHNIPSGFRVATPVRPGQDRSNPDTPDSAVLPE